MKTLTWQKPGQQNVAQELIKIIINYVAELRFILPTYSENFGIAIAEALACGTPVITTQGTPWKELESYQCGWWIPIGTTAIIEALKHFLQCTESDLEKMGRSGRKLIEEKYSSKNMAINMIEVYRKMQI